MMRHEILIRRALDHAIDKDPETLKIVIDLVVEYKIAVNHALKLEETIKAYMKDGEKVLQEIKDVGKNDRSRM